MPRKKKETKEQRPAEDEARAHIQYSGEISLQQIPYTLESNFMPYAMSVILSRAIPDIDGFKPSHRKLLYTMFLMGLINGQRVKSANIVGRTMQLNPHGDASIYETMVRLSQGNETLLHPYVDSKGNFGKAYSRNMAYAASRYTEAKLDKICNELFADINSDTVDFVPNYDNSMLEPTLLPVTFPTILVNNNDGIAVGMASRICSFNLAEVCKTTIEYIKNPEHEIADTLLAPDFAGGAQILYDRDEMESIYRTGRGSFKLRAKYTFDKKNSCIDITEIPQTTCSEDIIDKIIDLAKGGKYREIKDVRDETDKNGLKITIDVARGTNIEKLMQRLFHDTQLEDSFSCNFNILVGNVPKVMGIAEILEEWTAFREECIKRRTAFNLDKARTRLHLLLGLEKILLDIDKAIKIVRETEAESDVVPNLMIGFGIDKEQAEYVAEIKLRHLNREYILNRLKDIESLQNEIKDMESILASRQRIREIIIADLENVIKKYGKERKTEIIYKVDAEFEEIPEEIPDYAVKFFFTEGGYFKKITPQSLKKSGAQKLKEGDKIITEADGNNTDELLFFTNKAQVYKTTANAFADTKASVMGDFIPGTLKMDPEEMPVAMTPLTSYKGYFFFFFKNGRVAKIDAAAYETKTKRKKLIKAYSDKSELVSVIKTDGDAVFVLKSSAGRHLLLDTAVIAPKSTRDSQGVAVMTFKKGHSLMSVEPYREGMFVKPSRYRTRNLPAMGAFLSDEDMHIESMEWSDGENS